MTMRKLGRNLVLAAAVLAALATAGAANTSLTGVVTDDMCARKHTMMPGKPDSECVKACVKAGAKYALQAGDKLYILQANPKQLEPFAGKKVQVSGEVKGNTVAVSSIAEAK